MLSPQRGTKARDKDLTLGGAYGGEQIPKPTSGRRTQHGEAKQWPHTWADKK